MLHLVKSDSACKYPYMMCVLTGRNGLCPLSTDQARAGTADNSLPMCPVREYIGLRCKAMAGLLQYFVLTFNLKKKKKKSSHK